jgi:hypothetical protein
MTSRKRQEIINDEQLRISIRENKTKGKSNIATFVNSSFGIWVLSTMFVGLGTFLYTKYTENRENKFKKMEEMSRLKFDLFVLCDDALALMSDSVDYNSLYNGLEFFRYNPGQVTYESGRDGNPYTILLVLNRIASISSKDTIARNFRDDTYDLALTLRLDLENFYESNHENSSTALYQRFFPVNGNGERFYKLRQLIQEIRKYAKNNS